MDSPLDLNSYRGTFEVIEVWDNAGIWYVDYSDGSQSFHTYKEAYGFAMKQDGGGSIYRLHEVVTNHCLLRVKYESGTVTDAAPVPGSDDTPPSVALEGEPGDATGEKA